MFKVWICLIILLSCGSEDNGNSSKEPNVWQTEKVVLEYKAHINPARSGEKIEEDTFIIPSRLGIDEVAKVSFVFNSKDATHFKNLRLANNCESSKISTRFINLRDKLQVKKVGKSFLLDKNTDYALEVWVEGAHCRGLMLTLLSWMGNTPNGTLNRTCKAAIGNGGVNFKHTLLDSRPVIKLGEYGPNFFDANTFCGVKVSNVTCKNKIANFSWECISGSYYFELNYSNGLKAGAYACKENGEYIHLAQLSNCFDTISEN